MTRRRLLRMLTAAGFSTTTAAALTVDDVTAAASDQVPISLDRKGSSKVMVDADWYDQLQFARNVTDQLSRKWISGARGGSTHGSESDVVAVWLNGGGKRSEPHAVVTLDINSETKDETRGRIPETREGIPIEIEEAPREEELVACPDDDCNPYPKSDTSKMPGACGLTSTAVTGVLQGF